MKNYKNKIQGFSLIELLITLSITVILMTIGMPSLSKILKKNQVSSVYNEALSALSFTRSSAITKSSWVTFCKSNTDGSTCDANSSNWNNGWIVFQDTNNNGTVDGSESILLKKNDIPENIDINFSRNNSRISYSAKGYATGYNGKVTFCDTSRAIKTSMIISNTGRIRLAKPNEQGICG